MDKTSQAQGDMERAGDSLANQQKLNAEAKELQLYFGKGLVKGFGDTSDTGSDLSKHSNDYNPRWKRWVRK